MIKTKYYVWSGLTLEMDTHRSFLFLYVPKIRSIFIYSDSTTRNAKTNIFKKTNRRSDGVIDKSESHDDDDDELVVGIDQYSGYRNFGFFFFKTHV